MSVFFYSEVEKKTRKTKSSKKWWLVFSSSFPLTHKMNKKFMLKYYCCHNNKKNQNKLFLSLKKILNFFIYYMKVFKTFKLKKSRFTMILVRNSRFFHDFCTKFQVFQGYFQNFSNSMFFCLNCQIPAYSRLFPVFLVTLLLNYK